jgi:hypothetical protein
MTKKEKLSSFDNLIYEEMIYIYNFIEKWFDYNEKIETALGIYDNKHISIIFEKVN